MLLPTSVHLLVVLAGIHGTIRSAGHGGPLAGVRIEIDGATSLSSDTAGRYTATGLAPGPHEIRFLAAGYRIERATVILTDASDLTLDIELTAQPLMLSPIEVIADSARRALAGTSGPASVLDEAGHYRFTSGWQANQPAGATDIQQLIATVPGVTTRNDNTTALSIRGGRGSENLMLLDGIPITGAVHFAGASSAINPDAISTVDIHTGVSSVRFDDALSGVVELATADAAPQHAQVTSALTISDVRSVFRAPLEPGGSVLLGARSSFRNLLTDGAGFGSLNGYQDFIAAGHLRLGAGTVGIVAFASNDHLNWQPVADGTLPHPADDGSGGVSAPTANGAAWRSDAAGITWTHPGGISGEWRAAGWWTGSGAGISLQSPGQAQYISNAFGELGASIERRQRYGTSALLLGGELKQPRTSYGVATWHGTQRPDSGTAIVAAPVLASLYGEWDWHAWAPFDVRAGMRVSSGTAGVISVDPRLVLNLQVEPGTRFEAAAGRTHQTTQSLLNEESLTSTIVAPPLMTIATTGTPVATADQWQLSIERQVGRGLAIALDAYLRSWDHVVVPATTGALLAVGAPEIGAGRARGLLASAAIVEGSFTMHLAGTLESVTQQAGGTTYQTGFEQPWSIAGDLGYHPSARSTVQIHMETGAGRPTTPLSPGLEWHSWQPATGTGEMEGLATAFPGPLNTLRLPGPLRVDIGLRRDWRIGPGGNQSMVTTTLRLNNVLGRPDPVGLVAEPDGSFRLLSGTPRGLVLELGWRF